MKSQMRMPLAIHWHLVILIISLFHYTGAENLAYGEDEDWERDPLCYPVNGEQRNVNGTMIVQGMTASWRGTATVTGGKLCVVPVSGDLSKTTIQGFGITWSATGSATVNGVPFPISWYASGTAEITPVEAGVTFFDTQDPSFNAWDLIPPLLSSLHGTYDGTATYSYDPAGIEGHKIEVSGSF